MIIGGGVIGTAISLALAERGARVRVLEMRGVGLGATQASAGMLAPYIEGHGDALLTLGVAGASLAIALVLGLAGTWRALAHKPAPLLRNA